MSTTKNFGFTIYFWSIPRPALAYIEDQNITGFF